MAQPGGLHACLSPSDCARHGVQQRLGEPSLARGLCQVDPGGVRSAANGLFFPSIQATLNHILVIDRFYVDALEGGTLGPAAWADPVPCPTVSELRPAQAAVDRRLIAWCEALGEAAADQIIHVHRGTRVQTERADRLLLHLYQHQIHHRGQAHAMLSDTAVPPPQLDEFFSIAETPLRTAEFDELGWTEATVWRE